MHIYEYMRDRASLLLTICAIVCLIVVMLYLLSISWLLIDVLLIGIILCVLIGTTIDYIFYVVFAPSIYLPLFHQLMFFWTRVICAQLCVRLRQSCKMQ